MKQRNMIVWLCMLLTVSSLSVAQNRDMVTVLKNAIDLKVSFHKTTFDTGDPVIVKITATNISKEFLWLSTSPYKLKVVREDGSEVQDSPHGMVRKQGLSGDRSFAPSLSLDAGKSTIDEENLSDLFMMDRPGIYLVSVSQDLDNGARHDVIRSNVLKIIVK